MAFAPDAASAQRITDIPDPSKDLYPAKRNEKFTLDRPLTDEKINGSYNNFYEFGTIERRHQGVAGAAHPSLDGEDRRPRGEAVRDRHRRSHPQVRNRRAALSASLRRSLVDDDSVVGLSVLEARRIREADKRREICPHGNLPGSANGAGSAAGLVSVALCRRADHGGSEQRALLSWSPAPTASRPPSSMARRCVSRCRGNTASSRSNRS